MKIIDLLNKIANNEELPKAFVYNDKLWRLASDGTYFIGNDYGYDFWLAHGDDKFEDEPIKLYELNDKVEIIGDKKNKVEIIGDKKNKEEKKIPEKIEYYDDSIAWVIDDVGQLSDVDKVIIDTLNGVIDYLKSKGE